MDHSRHTTHLKLWSDLDWYNVSKAIVLFIRHLNPSGLWQNSTCLNWRKDINAYITIPLSKKYRMAIVKQGNLRAVPTDLQLNHSLLLISLGKNTDFIYYHTRPSKQKNTAWRHSQTQQVTSNSHLSAAKPLFTANIIRQTTHIINTAQPFPPNHASPLIPSATQLFHQYP